MKELHQNTLLITIIIALTFLLFYQLGKSSLRFEDYVGFAWIGGVTFLTWYGNKLISRRLDKRFPWIVYMLKRLWIQLVVSVLYVLVCINVSFVLFRMPATSQIPTLQEFYIINTLGFLIALPIISTHLAIYFLGAWRESHVQSERFQKESVRAQLEALRNHLDPHFLFNNLNILSSLIDKDGELAKEYLDHLADVYRYVLQNRDTELVSLVVELEFIEAYLFLLNIRFGKDLKVSFEIEPDAENLFLPPLSLQLLVENAIKHNIVNDEQPLFIEINTKNGLLVVKNNLQLKIQTNYSAKSGLKNIENRYKYLTHLKPEIIQSEDFFTVHLPLLDVEEA